MAPPLGFFDHQLQAVMAAASVLRVEDRAEFLELISSQLKIRDLDVEDATDRALRFFQERLQCGR